MSDKNLQLNCEYAKLYYKNDISSKNEKKITTSFNLFMPYMASEYFDTLELSRSNQNNKGLEQVIDILISDYENTIKNSKEIFENRLKEDGWTEDIGEGAVKIWNLFTWGDWEGHTASKIREDFQKAQVYIEELKVAQKSGSVEQLNETFKNIYGKNFNKETIDKYIETNQKFSDITVSYAELEEYKAKTHTIREGDPYTKAMDNVYSNGNFDVDMENFDEHIKTYEKKIKSFYEKRGINIDFEQMYQEAGVYEEGQEYPEKPKDGFKTEDEKREYWLKCMDIKIANKQRLKKIPPQPAAGFKTPQEYQKYFFECQDIRRTNENCKNYKKYCALRDFANQQNEMFSNILKDKYKTMNIEGNDFKQMYLSAKKKNDEAYEHAFGSTNKLMKTVTEYQNAQKVRGEVVKGVGLFAGTMLTAGSLGAPLAAATSSFVIESSNQMSVGIKKSIDGYGVQNFFEASADEIKKEGLLSVVKNATIKGVENITFKENSINAVTVGAVTVMIGGTGYLVSNISKCAGAGNLTTAIFSGISEIGAGMGTEYALTGEVTVKGTVYIALFTVTGKVLSLIPKTQVAKIKPTKQEVCEKMLETRKNITKDLSSYTEGRSAEETLYKYKELYMPQNEIIRKNIATELGEPYETIFEDTGKEIPWLDSLVGKSKIPTDTVLYRGGSPRDFGITKMTSDEFLGKFYKKGSYFKLPTYPETTLNKDVGATFCENPTGTPQGKRIMFRINAPKGTNGLYMEDLNGKTFTDFCGSEEEIILPRNSIFRFGDRIVGKDYDIIDLDIVRRKPLFKKVHEFQTEIK